jgi:hypothetical protein
MQIDLISDEVAEAPFIRIFDLSLDELASIRAYARDLASGRSLSVLLTSQGTSNGTKLRMTTDAVGVTVETSNSFLWGLRPTQWQYVSELVEGVMEAEDPYIAHQWLAGSMAMDILAVGEISVLISPSKKGQW